MPDNQTNSNTVYSGPYQTKQEHSLNSNILQSARDSFEAAGLYFSSNAISDASVRARYADGIRRVSKMVQEEVDSGRMSVADGASFCQTMRNQIMEETRKITSPQALPFAQVKKAQGLHLETLLDR